MKRRGPRSSGLFSDLFVSTDQIGSRIALKDLVALNCDDNGHRQSVYQGRVEEGSYGRVRDLRFGGEV